MGSANPWIVGSYQEFLFYNCPECEYKSKELGHFHQHAVNVHELAKDALNAIEVKESEKDSLERIIESCGITIEEPPIKKSSVEDICQSFVLNHGIQVFSEEPGNQFRHKQSKHGVTSVTNIIEPKVIKYKKCGKCDIKFKYFHNLLKHMSEVHNITTDFPCELCDFIASVPSELKNHRSEKHGLVLKRKRAVEPSVTERDTLMPNLKETLPSTVETSSSNYETPQMDVFFEEVVESSEVENKSSNSENANKALTNVTPTVTLSTIPNVTATSSISSVILNVTQSTIPSVTPKVTLDVTPNVTKSIGSSVTTFKNVDHDYVLEMSEKSLSGAVNDETFEADPDQEQSVEKTVMEVDEKESSFVPKLPNLKCKICKETLATTKDLRNHLQLEHYCAKCDFIAPNMTRLSYHLRSVHNISTLPKSVTSVQKPTETIENIEACEIILDPSTGEFINSASEFLNTAKESSSGALDKEDESLVETSQVQETALGYSGFYKCDSCECWCLTEEELKLHKQTLHELDENSPQKSSQEPVKTFISTTESSVEVTAQESPIHVPAKPNQFYCNMCKIFSPVEHFKEHLEKKECGQCDLTFSYFHTLAEHLNLVHSSDMRLNCDQCSYHCSNIADMDNHKHLVHNCERIICDEESSQSTLVTNQCYLCENTTFTTKEELRKHILNKHMKGMNECPECQMQSENFYFVLEHMVTVHGKKMKLECFFCPEIFSMPLFWKNHLANVHRSYKSLKDGNKDTSPYQCYNCIHLHQETDDVQDRRSKHVHCPIQCYFCGFTDKLKSTVIEHIKTEHTKEFSSVWCLGSVRRPELQCEECKHVFKDMFQKYIHVCGEENPNWMNPHMAKVKKGYDCTKCDMCDKVFTTYRDYLLHRAKSHIKQQYQCDLCSFATWIPVVFSYHVNQDHQEKSFFSRKLLLENSSNNRCDICDIGLPKNQPKIDYLTLHRQMDHGLLDLKCKKCNFVTQSQEEYKNHLLSHNQEGKERCDICLEVFTNRVILKGHKWRIHKQGFKCTQCDYLGFDEMDLADHVNVVHHNGKAICNVCDKEFKTFFGLQQHVQKVHSMKQMKCPGPACGIYMKTYETLIAHTKKYHQIIFVCSICEEMCSSRKGLIEHIKEKHGIECSKADYYICPWCREKFHSNEDLNEHFHTEHKVPMDHACDKCDKKFSTKLLLTIHTMELHEFKLDSASITNDISIAAALKINDVKVVEEAPIERNFECQECGKKLRTKKYLLQHFRQMHQPWTHNHFCHLCSWSTFEKAKLKQHIFGKHAVGDDLKCDICSKTFKSGSSLQSHKMKKHQGPKKKCPECPGLFQTNCKLAKHVWEEHGMRFKYKKYY